VKWFFERLLVAIIVSGLTGIVGAWVFLIAGILSDGGGVGNVSDFITGVLGISALGFLYAAVLGVVPAMGVICLSPASERPRQSAPTLLTGSAIGVVVGITIATWGPFVRANTFVLWVVFATLGGIAALWIRKPWTVR